MYPSIQYIAGFLDGEGCFDWSGNQRLWGGPRVRISNTYLPILKEIQSMFGGRIDTKNQKKGPIRKCYEWCLDGEAARYLIRSVLPYLVEKQEQARLLLQAHSIKPMVRKPLLDRVKELKRIDYEQET